MLRPVGSGGELDSGQFQEFLQCVLFYSLDEELIVLEEKDRLVSRGPSALV